MSKVKLCLQSNFYSERPQGTIIDTIVIHSMHNSGDCSACSCKECLDGFEVSAHYMIEPDGTLYRCVPEKLRAWHAGDSRMPFSDDLRTNVNDFSIGIELLWDNSSPFPDKQYEALEKIILEISGRHPIVNIVGHDQVAPERKVDPGVLFDWGRLANLYGRFRFK